MSTPHLLEALVEVGWFEGKPEAYRRRVEEQLEAWDGKLSDGTELGDILADFVYDTEAIDGEGDYSRIVGEYAKAAAPLLVIDEISDSINDDNREATVAFRAAGQPYKVTVPVESDWIHQDVLALLDTAASNHSTHRFELIPALDQCAYVAFVKAGSVKALIERGLLLDFKDLAESYM